MARGDGANPVHVQMQERIDALEAKVAELELERNAFLARADAERLRAEKAEKRLENAQQANEGRQEVIDSLNEQRELLQRQLAELQRQMESLIAPVVEGGGVGTYLSRKLAEAERKQAQDQEQCDEMTSQTAQMAVELKEAQLQVAGLREAIERSRVHSTVANIYEVLDEALTSSAKLGERVLAEARKPLEDALKEVRKLAKEWLEHRTVSHRSGGPCSGYVDIPSKAGLAIRNSGAELLDLLDALAGPEKEEE